MMKTNIISIGNNMEKKMSDPDFLGDTQLLIRPDREFNPQAGYDLVHSVWIDKKRGCPWEIGGILYKK